MVRAGAIMGLFLGVAAALTAVPEQPSFASEQPIVLAQNGPGGFFKRLFGGFRDTRPQPQPPAQGQGFPFFPGFEQTPTPRPQRRVRAPAQSQAPSPVAAVQKADNAKRAMVVGDFMAGALAKGLADAYSDNANVLVIDATNGSSGLVRDDFYDWPAKLPGLVESQKPDAILVMIGGNDRQTLQTDAGAQSPGSDAWRAAYVARVVAFADALKATGKPLVWVGLVPVQSSVMSRDYSTINGIMREQLEAKGVTFVDVWNGFADSDGKYVDVGPDVNGQSVQLRASDGLNFTKAGQRKLAYFVQQDLDDIFGGTSPAASASAAPTAPKVPNGPQIGPMVPLDALSAAGGDALSTDKADAARGGVAEAIAARLANKDAALPPAGRADSYFWPPRPATDTAAQ